MARECQKRDAVHKRKSPGRRPRAFLIWRTRRDSNPRPLPSEGETRLSICGLNTASIGLYRMVVYGYTGRYSEICTHYAPTAPMKAKLTLSLLGGLETTGSTYEVHDTAVTGLFVRVTAAGHKSYVVRWARGKKKTLGRVGVVTRTSTGSLWRSPRPGHPTPCRPWMRSCATSSNHGR